MGKWQAANDPDPETGWEAFVAGRRKQIEDRQEPPYIPPKPVPPQKLEDISPDVPYADDTITCWNGKAFVSWEKWRLSVPFTPITDSENPPEGGS